MIRYGFFRVQQRTMPWLTNVELSNSQFVSILKAAIVEKGQSCHEQGSYALRCKMLIYERVQVESFILTKEICSVRSHEKW